jgi:hypothetical protein
LNDPYEGELFTWWLYFFGGLSQKDKDLLWEVKRPQLVSVEYNMGGVGPITVQKGNRNTREYRRQLIILQRILVFGPRTMESDGNAILRR